MREDQKKAENLKHQSDVMNDVLENLILKLLAEDNRLKQKQIAAETDKSIASVQCAMNKLSEQGRISRIGGKHLGYWAIK